MKINILFQLNNNPSGGGNQFLKALKKTLIKKICMLKWKTQM